MQYVLCFVCGVLVYRIEIKVIEFVLVHVGEPLLVGAALRVRAGAAVVAIATDNANATVILIGSPTDDTTVAVSAAADDATTSTATTTTATADGTAANEANRAERPGADNATSIAIGTPETWTKLTKRRLRRYWIRPGRLY